MSVSAVLALLMKATFLFLTGLAFLRFSRRFSPAVRHLICLATIGGSLAILATVFLPDPAVIVHVPASIGFLPATHLDQWDCHGPNGLQQSGRAVAC